MCNMEEKTLGAKWQNGTTRQTKNHALTPKSTHDLKCALWIRSHVIKDIRKGMIMQFVWNDFLKSILSSLYKLHERRNTSHHIQGKELMCQQQMNLEGECTRTIGAYHLNKKRWPFMFKWPYHNWLVFFLVYHFNYLPWVNQHPCCYHNKNFKFHLNNFYILQISHV